jgi:YVTN family beta-propeller protein
VTSRQNNVAGIDGNTISFIDVDRARQGLPGAERARLLVGADRPDQPTRPFSVAWTPDGRVVVANFRTNTVSVVDVPAALTGQSAAEVARIGLDRPDGAPARPKIVAVTRDGRYAVVTGGDDTLAASTTRATGMAYVIDLRTLSVAAQVTGVGIDPYGVTVVEDAE